MTEKRPRKSGEKRSDGQTISRAVAILRALAEQPGASFGQVAKMTGLPRSTVQRLIGVMNKEGLVTKAFGQQGAFLGMELARLGARVQLDARGLLKPFMQELHARIGDNIDLTSLDDGRVFVVEQIASNEGIRVISYVGKEHPIHCTANGKAHLSLLARDEALALLGPSPAAMTKNTLTDPEAILDAIERAREVGVFVDIDEYEEGASAMAVPLPRIGARDFALSIAMPTSRFIKMQDEIAAALLALRERVVSEYGRSI